MSNLCDEASERDVAVETIEELFESTRRKKEQFHVFYNLPDANYRDIEVWKRYAEKVEEVYEGEEVQDMAVVDLAYRAIVPCGD